LASNAPSAQNQACTFGATKANEKHAVTQLAMANTASSEKELAKERNAPMLKHGKVLKRV
jgi:hypothetical protein